MSKLPQNPKILTKTEKEALASNIFSQLLKDGYRLQDVVCLSSQLLGMVSDHLKK